MSMDLLSFARGPALQWALVICVLGICWRLAGILLLRRAPDYAEPRNALAWPGAFKLIVSRSWPRREFAARTALGVIMSYVFHIGLAIVVFGFAPHILLLQSLTGLSWPNLPTSLITLSAALTVGALGVLLVRRLVNPVLRLLSNFDDYFSWLVTLLPAVTGMMATAHFGPRYETMLAVHILSGELLLIWLPFGKLMHSLLVFVARGTTGVLFTRKGAAL